MISSRKLVIVLCVGLGAVGSLWGEALPRVVYRMDFANQRQYRAVPGQNWVVARDGRSIRHGNENWALWSFGLGQLPKVTGEYRLSFDVREFGVEPCASDYHWGFNLIYGDGCKAHFHTLGKGFHFMCHAASGKSLCSAGGGSHAIDRQQENPGWTRVTLDVRRDSFAIRMAGETCVQQGFGLVPLEGIGFYAWRVDVELRDIVIETLPPIDDKNVQEATFDLATATPAESLNAVWTNGINGARALRLRAPGWGGAKHRVTYAFDDAPIGTAFGGVSCWARYMPGTPIVKFLDADGKRTGDLSMRGDLPIGFHCMLEDGKHSLTFRRRVPPEELRYGEWFHFAFTWDRDGSYRFFVNGLPYATGDIPGADSAALILGNVFGKTRKIVLESENPQQDLTVQDLRLYRRPLKNREVELAYRRGMPVDIVMGDNFMPADKPARLKIEIAPGGMFTHCKPVAGERDVKTSVDLSVTVEKVGPKPTKFMEKRVYAPCGITRFAKLRVTRPMTVETDPMTLAAGSYRVRAALSNGYERYLFFSVHDEPVRALPAADGSRWQKGELLWSHAFRRLSDAEKATGEPEAVASSPCGGYLEAGSNGSLGGDRYGCVIPFAPEHLGKPCLMTFTWPDDKARTFGLYMFKETPNLKSKMHRDRLQGGILAGGIYKTTGQMQKSEFLFYPSDTNHWFETRTFVDGEPAALAKVEVNRLKTPWPRLKLNIPDGLPGRTFGYTDEDQTFDHNFNTDFLKHDTRAITATLLDYFDYTGQNAFHYALARYTSTLGAQVGFSSNGMYPYMTASSSQVVREMTAAGVDYVGEVYFNELAETRLAKCIEGDRSHWIMRDKEGSEKKICGVNGYANFAIPEVTEAYLDHYMDEVDRLAKNGMKGLRHWLCGVRAFGAWDSPDVGYDDGNFAQFKADTGFAGRGLPAVATSTGDFLRRYEVLNSAEVLPTWQAWRAEKVTQFVARMVARVQAVAPGLPVYVELGTSNGSPDDLLKKRGVDIDALARIPNVRLVLSHSPTSQHWMEFRRFAKKTGAKSRDWESYFSPTNLLAARIRKLQGAVPLCVLHNTYFETFRDSLGGNRFGSYFQSMDPKPWGRNFLREFAWAMACGDPLSIVIGDQPVGTLGSEDEAREFARAYRALPAIPFEDVRLGVHAPPGVLARRAKTKNGIYCYLVNLSGDEHEVALTDKELKDLSTGENVSGRALKLKPYELRSFLKEM